MSTTQEEPTGVSTNSLNEISEELYATQGGGLATRNGTTYVWYELPDWYAKFPEIDEKVGDPIPDQWSVVPVNTAALNSESDPEANLALVCALILEAREDDLG